MRKLRETIHAIARRRVVSLADFAKRLPRSASATEIIRRIEQEAQRREQQAEQHQRERTQQMRGLTAPALRM